MAARAPQVGGLTVHPVTGRPELRALAARMDNCLETYGPRRLRGRNRIVEVRRGGRTVYAVHVHDGRIEMFESPGNRGPDPEDVPLVRGLLQEHGILAATRTAAEAEVERRRQGLRAARRAEVDDAAMPQLPLTEADAPAPAGAPAVARGPARPPARVQLPGPPAVSVQALATELLQPGKLWPPDWGELAAALWAVGVLPAVVDPEDEAIAPIVTDLAAHLAQGAWAGLVRHEPPDRDACAAAVARLRADADRATSAGRRRAAMAHILTLHLRP